MGLPDLAGRVAVVTGGNRGIGLGMARGLAAAGASVAIWGRNRERNEAAVAELATLGPAAFEVGCDVADEAAVAVAVAATVDRFERIDVLFANAGLGATGSFPDVDLADWGRVLAVNLDGAFLTSRAVARHMIDRGAGGSLVFTSSVAAHTALADAAAYAVTKAGVLQFARVLAVKLARYGIRSNSITPGWVTTEMTTDQHADAAFDRYVLSRTPLRRWGEPDDFAGPAVFLASDASAYVTGTELVVDGGFGAT